MPLLARTSGATIFALLLACGSSPSPGGDVTSPPAADGGASDAVGVDSSSPDAATACPSPQVTCGSTCVDLGTSAANCGTCGYACAAGATCHAGSCTSSASLTVTSLSSALGPLSGGTWVTLQGTGFAAGARVSFGGSVAPSVVVDSTTIQALTSPGVAGVVDVSVAQAVGKAVRGRAFTYAPFGYKGPWQEVNLSAPRGAYPGMSVLTDGRALITGGRSASNNTDLLTTADLYAPATNAVTHVAATMAAARVFVAQVTLLSGKVLVVGTQNAYTATPNAEVFDPATSTFAAAKGQPPAQLNMAYLALLPDGRVAVTSQNTAALLVYDPAADAFTSVAGSPDVTNYEPDLLLDGRVLLVPGGPSQPAYVFDPGSGAFAPAGTGPVADASTWVYRGARRSLVLPDGRVLSVGGYGATSVSIFDPASPGAGFVTAPYALQETLHYTTVALMGDGTVLVIGGASTATGSCGAGGGWTLSNNVEQIDPVKQTLGLFDALPDGQMDMGAVTLLDGSVIAGGGEVCGGAATHAYLYYLKGVPPQAQ